MSRGVKAYQAGIDGISSYVIHGSKMYKRHFLPGTKKCRCTTARLKIQSGAWRLRQNRPRCAKAVMQKPLTSIISTRKIEISYINS